MIFTRTQLVIVFFPRFYNWTNQNVGSSILIGH